MSGWDDPGHDVGADLAEAVRRGYEAGLRAPGGLVIPELYREQVDRQIRDALPTFSAVRGGFDWNREPGTPPSRWQKRKWRFKARWNARRERLALAIAPWLERDPWD